MFSLTHSVDPIAHAVTLCRPTGQGRPASTGVEPLSEWPLLPRSFQKELGARSSDERTLPPFGGAACPCASAAILPKYAFACDAAVGSVSWVICQRSESTVKVRSLIEFRPPWSCRPTPLAGSV